jgi:hypothetical protein
VVLVGSPGADIVEVDLDQAMLHCPLQDAGFQIRFENAGK